MNFPEDQFARRVLTMQIIAAALVAAVVILGSVSLVMVNNNGPLGPAPAPGALPIISVVALAMLATCVPLSLIVPNTILRGAVQRIAAGTWKAPEGVDAAQFASDEAKLLAARQTTMIVGNALLEGAGTIACVAYMLEGQTFALTTAAVVVLFMVFQFPTQGRIREWLERHVALVTELRQLGGPTGPY
jgi:hypothetical protein